MLHKQGGGLAFLLCFFKNLLCLFYLFYFCLHDFIPDFHLHAVDRRILVQREEVSCVERCLRGVDEGLDHGHPRKISLNINFQVRLQCGQIKFLAILCMGFYGASKIISYDGVGTRNEQL